MNKISLKNILIMSAFTAAVGAVVGYIVSRRATLYFNKDKDEYMNPTNIDIPIDVLMDEETE